MGKWKQSGENLVRHESGTYYLRCKVRGRIVMRSLKTDSLVEARKRRMAAREALEATEDGGDTRITLGTLLSRLEAKLTPPSLKPSSRHYYRQLVAAMRATLPVGMRAERFAPADARLWWESYATRYSPTRANNTLALCKRLEFPGGKNHFAGIPRMKQKPMVLDLPDRDGMERIMAACRESSGLMIGFLAWSGLRRGEARALRWEDVGEKWILVTGGKGGTKSRKPRRVPISGPLAAIVARLRDGAPPKGPLFRQLECCKALKNACKRCGFRPMRMHDLRHWFATHAVERGVDVPTVSRWLGHQDGGILAMRTYGHARDDHSLESAAKL